MQTRDRIRSARGIIPVARLAAGYATGITRRIRKRNNRAVDIQFSGCIGQGHCASSGQLRRRGDLTVDSFQIELGALRSNISLTLHTFHAALIWRGRTARLGARPILGEVYPGHSAQAGGQPETGRCVSSKRNWNPPTGSYRPLRWPAICNRRCYSASALEDAVCSAAVWRFGLAPRLRLGSSTCWLIGLMGL